MDRCVCGNVIWADGVCAHVFRGGDHHGPLSEAEPSGPAGLDELSKQDLLRLAEDADVVGRSAMTKAELVAALS